VIDCALIEMAHRGAVFSDEIGEMSLRMYALVLTRELTRADLRAIVRRGLAQTCGNYKIVVDLFNMPQGDYRRFSSFLLKYDCDQRVPRVHAEADSTKSARQKSSEV